MRACASGCRGLEAAHSLSKVLDYAPAPCRVECLVYSLIAMEVDVVEGKRNKKLGGSKRGMYKMIRNRERVRQTVGAHCARLHTHTYTQGSSQCRDTTQASGLSLARKKRRLSL
jgi:hypothetical protein